ncbi:Trefoil factor 3 [Varanus komodoensis]|nr:Trefoil factor 3 [Varanus komodoensis]
MDRSAREECGYPAITAEECQAKGCCFDSYVVNTRWCFRPLSEAGNDAMFSLRCVEWHQGKECNVDTPASLLMNVWGKDAAMNITSMPNMSHGALSLQQSKGIFQDEEKKLKDIWNGFTAPEVDNLVSHLAPWEIFWERVDDACSQRQQYAGLKPQEPTVTMSLPTTLLSLSAVSPCPTTNLLPHPEGCQRWDRSLLLASRNDGMHRALEKRETSSTENDTTAESKWACKSCKLTQERQRREEISSSPHHISGGVGGLHPTDSNTLCFQTSLFKQSLLSSTPQSVASLSSSQKQWVLPLRTFGFPPTKHRLNPAILSYCFTLCNSNQLTASNAKLPSHILHNAPNGIPAMSLSFPSEHN